MDQTQTVRGHLRAVPGRDRKVRVAGYTRKARKDATPHQLH